MLLDVNLHFALKIEDAGAFQFDPIANQSTSHLSSAPRSLKRMKLSLTQTVGPVRCQHAMGSSCHRIFRDPFCWREVSTNKVILFLRRSGHDYAGTANAGKRNHIGRQSTQDLLALNQRQVVKLVAKNFDWIESEC